MLLMIATALLLGTRPDSAAARVAPSAARAPAPRTTDAPLATPPLPRGVVMHGLGGHVELIAAIGAAVGGVRGGVHAHYGTSGDRLSGFVSANLATPDVRPSYRPLPDSRLAIVPAVYSVVSSPNIQLVAGVARSWGGPLTLRATVGLGRILRDRNTLDGAPDLTPQAHLYPGLFSPQLIAGASLTYEM
jgi:hypothetical protein